jgi:hypothetical protein
MTQNNLDQAEMARILRLVRESTGVPQGWMLAAAVASIFGLQELAVHLQNSLSVSALKDLTWFDRPRIFRDPSTGTLLVKLSKDWDLVSFTAADANLLVKHPERLPVPSLFQN